MPQADGQLTLHIPLSSAIVLSLRQPPFPVGHGLAPQSQVQGLPICWRTDNLFSPSAWLTNPQHMDALTAVAVHPNEYLYVYRNGLDYNVQPRRAVDMLERIDAVLTLAAGLPSDEATRPFRSAAVPAELRPLRAVALKWGISDDGERAEAISHATRIQLTRLVAKVEPLLSSINAFLDEVDDVGDEASMLGDLAQAVLEAQIDLRARE